MFSLPGGLEVLDGPEPESILVGPRVGIEYASPEHVALASSTHLPSEMEERLSLGLHCAGVGMKTVRIFSDRIRDRIRLEGF
jgi:hypothetical protein